MLTEPTLEKLYAMKLNGLAEAWQEQQQQPHSSDLSFDERLAMLVERQWHWKENRALVTRLKFAQLKQSACLEDIDFRHPRGLKRAAVEQLAAAADFGENYQSFRFLFTTRRSAATLAV